MVMDKEKKKKTVVRGSDIKANHKLAVNYQKSANERQKTVQ